MGLDLRRYVRELPGKGRCDLTPLLADAAAFATLVEALAEPFRERRITHVAALDAVGFALGGAVAARLGAGLVLVRKSGKGAWHAEVSAFTDYTGQAKAFEVAADALGPGHRVLVVDDWTETGAQLRAAIGLIERLGGHVVGAAVLNADDRARRDSVLARHTLHAVITY